jgi:hypothetical protein
MDKNPDCLDLSAVDGFGDDGSFQLVLPRCSQFEGLVTMK